MQKPENPAEKLLPPAPADQVAFIEACASLSKPEKDVLAGMVQMRICKTSLNESLQGVRERKAENIDEIADFIDAPLALRDFRQPRRALCKLGYRLLCYLDGTTTKDSLADYAKRADDDFRQNVSLAQAELARTDDRADRLAFEAGEIVFSPTAKRIWNELADATGCETFPRYIIPQTAPMPVTSRPKSLGHS